jgi:hypothetical protein
MTWSKLDKLPTRSRACTSSDVSGALRSRKTCCSPRGGKRMMAQHCHKCELSASDCERDISSRRLLGNSRIAKRIKNVS